MARDICIDRLKLRASLHATKAAYHYKVQKEWQSICWQEYHEKVRRFAKALIKSQINPKSKIAILSFGRLEWVISAMGAQYLGAISVGIYTTSSQDEIKYIVDHSDAEILLIENKERYEHQIKPIKEYLNKIKYFIIMNNQEIDEYDEKILSFSQFMNMGKDVDDKDLDELFAKVEGKSPSTMIYTSGTTGNPKAVMISHLSIAFTVRAATQMFKCGFYDRNISYLPLAHVAEQMFTVYAPIDCGMQSYFSSSFDALKEEIIEVEPTIFFGVPRVFEKMHEGIKDVLSKKGKAINLIFNHLLKENQKFYELKNENIKPDFLFNLIHNIGKKYIFNSLKKKLGLYKARACLSGAAPISKDILNFFFGIDIPVYELYGLSETTGPASTNMPNQIKIGSVGHALPGTKVKIADDGEILISGPHVFLGYYKDEAASSEAIVDGFIRTGDIGSIDNEGFIYITDRKKDLLITAGGKNISPQNLESALKSLPFVQSAVVVGDKRKYLCALLAPNRELLYKKASEISEINKKIQNEIDLLNKKLSPVEQIKKYSLLRNEFSVDTGELTPTLKIKRKFINEKYKEEIEKLYQ